MPPREGRISVFGKHRACKEGVQEYEGAYDLGEARGRAMSEAVEAAEAVEAVAGVGLASGVGGEHPVHPFLFPPLLTEGAVNRGPAPSAS